MNKKETSLNILFTYLTIKTRVFLDQIYNILNHNTEISGTFHMLNIIQLEVLKKKKANIRQERLISTYLLRVVSILFFVLFMNVTQQGSSPLLLFFFFYH